MSGKLIDEMDELVCETKHSTKHTGALLRCKVEFNAGDVCLLVGFNEHSEYPLKLPDILTISMVFYLFIYILFYFKFFKINIFFF